MTTTHTPGPWETADLRVMWGSYFVADCDGKGDIGRQEEGRANARLIAAAPDLLQVALALVSAWDDEPTDFAGEIAYQVKQARAAIEKTRGAA